MRLKTGITEKVHKARAMEVVEAHLVYSSSVQENLSLVNRYVVPASPEIRSKVRVNSDIDVTSIHL